MGTWQGAWFLAKEEFKKIRWKHLITLVFIGYFTLFFVPMFIEAHEEKEKMSMVYWSLDFLSVTLLPYLGLMSTQAWGNYWRTDFYSKKLAGWRIMPIPIKQIVWGRLLLLILNTVPALILFYSIFYFVSRLMTPILEPSAFVPFAIFWMGYALAGSIIFTYLESGFSGKVYFWFCLCVTLGMLGAMVLSTMLLKSSFVLSSYTFIENGGWWLALIGIAMAALAIMIIHPLMEKKLRTRSYIS